MTQCAEHEVAGFEFDLLSCEDESSHDRSQPSQGQTPTMSSTGTWSRTSDARCRDEEAGPGGQSGTTLKLQRGRLNPEHRHFGDGHSRTRQWTIRPNPTHVDGPTPRPKTASTMRSTNKEESICTRARRCRCAELLRRPDPTYRRHHRRCTLDVDVDGCVGLEERHEDAPETCWKWWGRCDRCGIVA